MDILSRPIFVFLNIVRIESFLISHHLTDRLEVNWRVNSRARISGQPRNSDSDRRVYSRKLRKITLNRALIAKEKIQANFAGARSRRVSLRGAKPRA